MFVFTVNTFFFYSLQNKSVLYFFFKKHDHPALAQSLGKYRRVPILTYLQVAWPPVSHHSHPTRGEPHRLFFRITRVQKEEIFNSKFVQKNMFKIRLQMIFHVPNGTCSHFLFSLLT